MEDKKSLSIKKDMFNIGTQHNKLTTLVLVLLGEIEKIKKDIKIIKTNLNSLEIIDNEDNTGMHITNSSNSKPSDVDQRADQILQQLNLSSIAKNI